MPNRPYVRPSVRSFIRSSVRSFFCLPCALFTGHVGHRHGVVLHMCVRKPTRIDPSFVPSFPRSLVPSFFGSRTSVVLESFVPSFLRSFVPSFLRSLVPSFLRSLGVVLVSYSSLTVSHGALSFLPFPSLPFPPSPPSVDVWRTYPGIADPQCMDGGLLAGRCPEGTEVNQID
jgi:hypothetical protein